ncbi:3'-5' exonuclease family protein [Henriciella marina]|uniref:hypothetical protein n=1 Tax=Henriciella marina TaxID=453851 RepID=UPI0003A7065C|nr:hypothetical protein [Henriciella marina]
MSVLETDLFIRAYTEPPNWTPKVFRPAGFEFDITSDWQVIFDTETTVDALQKLRVGFAQVRHAGTLKYEVIFIADELPDADLAVVLAYASAHDLDVIPIEAFRRTIILDIGYLANGAIIGFNLPFDIARIALASGEARGSMFGGFTFRLTRWKSDPNIRIKHLNPTTALIDFAAPGKPKQPRSMRKRNVKPASNRGTFIDAKTIAAALLTGRYSLAALAKRLNTPTQKQETEEHGGPLTPEYLSYARDDVQATWECYEALAKIYAGFGLSTPLKRILSEASLGKALLREMNIRPLLRRDYDA